MFIPSFGIFRLSLLHLFIWQKNSDTVDFLKVVILMQKLVLTWYFTVGTVSAFLTTFVFGPEANSWRKIAELIVFDNFGFAVHCSVSIRKFTKYSLSNCYGPFFCQRLRIDVFSNFRVRLESRFIKEDVRIRKLTDVAQCIYGGFLGLYRHFSVAKKFITWAWNVL